MVSRRKKKKRKELLENQDFLFLFNIFNDRSVNCSKFAERKQPLPSMSLFSIWLYLHMLMSMFPLHAVIQQMEWRHSVCDKIVTEVPVFPPSLVKQKLAVCSCIPYCFDFLFSEWLLQSPSSLCWDLMIFSVKADKNRHLLCCVCLSTAGVCMQMQGMRTPLLGLQEMPPGRILEKKTTV